MAEFDEAVKLAPGAVRPHVRIAELLIETGDRPAAIQHMQEALRLRPASREIRSFLARVLSVPTNPIEITEDDRASVRVAADGVLCALASQEVRVSPASPPSADECLLLTEVTPAP
jgi:hypothetical protein